MLLPEEEIAEQYAIEVEKAALTSGTESWVDATGSFVDRGGAGMLVLKSNPPAKLNLNADGVY